MAGQQLRSSSRRALLSLLFSLLFLTSLLGRATALAPARRVADLELDKDVEAMITRATTGDQYLLGVGKADITGYGHVNLPLTNLTNISRPVVELNFMGYASLGQVGTGLRQR